MIEIRNKRSYSGPGVYIGRPSVLGNPYPLQDERERQAVIEKYRRWLRAEYAKQGAVYTELMRLTRLYKQEGQLILVCWCAPKACHGDVLKDAIEKLSDLIQEA